MIKSLIFRSQGISTRQALHILPPKINKLKLSINEIQGIKLPIWEKDVTVFNPVPPQDLNRFLDKIESSQLKINISTPNNLSLLEKAKSILESKPVVQPFILEEKVKPILKSFVFKSKILMTSTKKSTPVIRLLVGKYFFDAMAVANTVDKKVSKFLYETLRDRGLEFIKENSMDPRLLFISSLVINRKRRDKKIRYHARGRSGVKCRDYCIFKITLTEKPIKDFYKQMIIGKTPPFLSYLLKEKLIKERSDYQEVLNLQPLLHFSGRRQQRLLFNRKVLTKWIELRRNGFKIRLSLLKEKMLNEESEEFEKRFGYIFPSIESEREKRLEKRKILFEANQSIHK